MATLTGNFCGNPDMQFLWTLKNSFQGAERVISKPMKKRKRKTTAERKKAKKVKTVGGAKDSGGGEDDD